MGLINRSPRTEFDQERFEVQLKRYKVLIERAEKAQESLGVSATKAATAASALRKAADNVAEKLRTAARPKEW